MMGRIERARAGLPAVIGLLREWVEIESPSGFEPGNERLAHRVAAAFEARGARVTRHAAPGFGEHLEIDWGVIGGGDTPIDGGHARPLLVLGHIDTVHPVGTLQRLPFRVEGGRVEGPGVFDMKGGWATLLGALDLLTAEGTAPAGPLRILITCDEEVGSPTSRTLIEARARSARACLVLEPSLPGGAVKVRRKGVGELTLTVRGRAAHAGIEPEAGASAVVELAHQLLAIQRLTDGARGTHLNPGVVRGGTATNVVADEATVALDLRFWTQGEADRVLAGLRSLTPVNPRCTLEWSGGVNRPALEPSPDSAHLLDRAREAADTLGLPLAAGETGGGSDGNFTAAVGCPTLDGLGPEGGGAHTLHEHILLDPLPSRIALLAGILERV